MKEYGISFGRTEAAILVLSFVFMYVVITGSGLVPSAYFLIYLGVSPILGILYGPYAAIGAMLATLVTDYPEVAPVDICWDMLLTGATAIVPYKIWYSCFPNCGSRQPDLMSYRNTVKFIGCILAGAVIGTLLLDGFWIMRYGMDPVNDSAIISFLNLTGFSVLIGLTAIVIFRFFGIPFYGPRRRALHSILDRPNHRLYDLIILAAFLIILNSDWTADRDIAETGLTVSMVLVYLYVLLKPSYTVEPVPRSSVKLNRFDRSAIERVVLILLAEGLILCLLFLLASHYGIINNISNWNSQSSLLFYLNVALLMFFFPLLALLWYIENYLTKPIGFIAEEVRNYIGVDGVRGTMDLSSGRIGRSAEIGNLAMSIESMSEDLDRYIEDIKSLSAEKERYGAELSIASGIQLSLIPKEFDSVGDRANVAGVMQPAKYVGGDLYDFFPVDEDRLAIVIADVSGKGMPAALFMAITKILIEEHARPGVEPGTVLSEVNRSLCKNNDELMFVTVWVGILDLNDGTVRFANGGHCPPAIERVGAEPEFLQMHPGVVLGIDPEAEFVTEHLTLGRGDRILLYTDGVTEANCHYGGFFGGDRLLDALRSSEGTVSDQVDAVFQAVREFTSDADQFDDVTMIMTEYVGPQGSSS